ncbi:beta-N-acetylhexosaminidase [Paenibacillus castaneae]|uniref:beta-N-acetylhexosaminidase n=1 Tax=Paenibacillus castaneae TaxID=474957 RepID=UPI000C9AEE8F|nr:beta-N-acetylhexosaminidase [Paenibacillus castaneae]NIK80025.1 beta-N-acetylhexosaminidase [Paenibacillus castaneae]
MKQRKMIMLTVVLICCMLAACSRNANVNNGITTPSTSASPSIEPTSSPEPTDPIKDQIANMSLDEKIGQMVIVGLDGTIMQAEAKKMIDNYHVGGFILYKDNIADAPQTLALLNQLKAQNKTNQAPLWLSIDQEGGKVSRMPDEFMKLPAALEIGKKNNTQYTHQIGLALGNMVHALGFNMDFAPVLDINSNPKNPVIGNRSFGTNPDTVIKHAIETMTAIQSTGVAAVVKHFPGHGDTSVDSHLELPVVHKSLKELKSFELLPFIEAAEQNADAVMIAHLLIPSIDNQNPASLSKKIITDLLRDELHYDGVVITDDMTMGGITKHNDIGDAAVRSVLAGTDILLVGHDYKQQTAVLEALKKSVTDGAVSVSRLDDSIYRNLKLKMKYELNDSAVKSIDVKAINEQIKAALASK